MPKLFEEWRGVTTIGRQINNFSNFVLVSPTNELQYIMGKLTTVIRKYGRKFKADKTILTIIDRSEKPKK